MANSPTVPEEVLRLTNEPAPRREPVTIAAVEDPLEVRWTWGASPRGVSKRSIVHAWLRERGLATHWYQFESDDEQPVTILRHLPPRGERARVRAGVVAMLSEPPPGVVQIRVIDEPQPAADRWGADRRARNGLEGAAPEPRQRDEQDIAAHFLAVARAVDSCFLEENSPPALDTWIDALDRLLLITQGSIPEEAEIEVLRSARAVLFRDPNHRMLPGLAERAEHLARALPHREDQLVVALLALQYYAWSGELSRASQLSESIAEIVAETAAPLRLSFRAWRTALLSQQGETDAAIAELKRDLEQAQRSEPQAQEGTLQILLAETALRAGHTEPAARALEDAAPFLRGGLPGLVRHARLLKAGVLLLRNQADEAAHATRELMRGHEHDGRPPFTLATERLMFGQMLALQGRYAEAVDTLNRVLAFAQQMPSPLLEFQALSTLAVAAFAAADQDGADRHLCQALTLGARHNYKMLFPVGMPRCMAQLCARALEAGIETSYVKRLIRARGIKPESPETDDWPWPVRIYTLGRFAVVLDGERLGFSRKAPRKPLELLKAILAKGGRGVDQLDLREQLWPDLDGDASRNALELALRRLRLLLTSEDAIIVEGGTLALDPTQVWVDAWAFERLCGKIERLKASGIGKDELQARADRLLRLYTGQFLSGESLGWAFAARERLRSKFVRTVGRLGQLLEQAGPDENLAAFYRRAIELEPLAEELHVRLLQCLMAQHRVAECLDAYHRFRDLASAALGAQPSEPLRLLYARLRAMHS